MAYSWLISSISNYIKEKNKKVEEFNNKIEILNEIRLYHPNMTKDLYFRIYSHLEYQINNKNDNIKYLIDNLPESIKNDLINSIYKPILQNLNFFKNFKNSDFIHRIVTKLIPMRLNKNDIVVNQGDLIEDIIFIREGTLSMEILIDLNNIEWSLDQLTNGFFLNNIYNGYSLKKKLEKLGTKTSELLEFDNDNDSMNNTHNSMNFCNNNFKSDNTDNTYNIINSNNSNNSSNSNKNTNGNQIHDETNVMSNTIVKNNNEEIENKDMTRRYKKFKTIGLSSVILQQDYIKNISESLKSKVKKTDKNNIDTKGSDNVKSKSKIKNIKKSNSNKNPGFPLSYPNNIKKDKKNIYHIRLINVRKNQHFGCVYMFLNKRSPVILKVKSDRADILMLPKIDAIEISSKYPNVWKKVTKTAVKNIKSMINIAQKSIIQLFDEKGVSYNKEYMNEIKQQCLNDNSRGPNKKGKIKIENNNKKDANLENNKKKKSILKNYKKNNGTSERNKIIETNTKKIRKQISKIPQKESKTKKNPKKKKETEEFYTREINDEIYSGEKFLECYENILSNKSSSYIERYRKSICNIKNGNFDSNKKIIKNKVFSKKNIIENNNVHNNYSLIVIILIIVKIQLVI